MLRAFFRDESGSTSVEYALIASLIALAILGALNIVANNNSATFELITTAVEGANGGGTP